MWPDAVILVFWMLSFKPAFSLSTFTFIKRLFSSSLSAIRLVSSAYLRLLIFLPEILISAFASSSPAFLMMYSAHKFNKHSDSIQPWHTPFLIWYPDCWFLTCIQILQEAGKVVWYSHLLRNFPQFVVIHTVKGFSQSIAEVDVFLEFPFFFYSPLDVGNLTYGFSAFSKSSLYIFKFSVHILLKPGIENFEHYFTSVWNECKCAVVSTFFGIALLWDWNENWPFPVLWPLLSFPYLLAYWVQHFNSIIF